LHTASELRKQLAIVPFFWGHCAYTTGIEAESTRKDMSMIITEQILEQGMSRNGSFNHKQLKYLGVNPVNNPGWRKRLIGSSVPAGDIQRFIELKNHHLPAKQNLLFED